MRALFAIFLLCFVQVEFTTCSSWIGDDNVLDPITGLTSIEKTLIKNTWELLMRNPAEYGAKILMKYFNEHPEYLVYFPFKRAVLTDEEFTVFCNLVMYILDAVIDNLEKNPQITKRILRRIAWEFVKDRIRAAHFWELYEKIREIMRPFVNENTYKAWDKFLEFATNLISAELQDEF